MIGAALALGGAALGFKLGAMLSHPARSTGPRRHRQRRVDVFHRDQLVKIYAGPNINSMRPVLFVALGWSPSLMRANEQGRMCLAALAIEIEFRPWWCWRWEPWNPDQPWDGQDFHWQLPWRVVYVASDMRQITLRRAANAQVRR